MMWLFADQDLRCGVVFAEDGFGQVSGDDGYSPLSPRFAVLLIHGSGGINFIFLVRNCGV